MNIETYVFRNSEQKLKHLRVGKYLKNEKINCRFGINLFPFVLTHPTWLTHFLSLKSSVGLYRSINIVENLIAQKTEKKLKNKILFISLNKFRCRVIEIEVLKDRLWKQYESSKGKKKLNPFQTMRNTFRENKCFFATREKSSKSNCMKQWFC